MRPSNSMTGGERDPKISLRLPEERLEALDEIAEQYDISRSVLVRRAIDLLLEKNVEAVGINAKIKHEMEKIKETMHEIHRAGGFRGRMEDKFNEFFESGYDPKWIVASAEAYRKEARMLEEYLPEHPEAPPIEDGEFVDVVDDVVEKTIRSHKLSEYGDRYDGMMKSHGGVEEGLESRKFALAMTKGAMNMDIDGYRISGAYGGERRVDGDDLSAYAVDQLPEGVDRNDVARVARELVDAGVHPEDVETDPEEFDPFETDDIADGTPDDVLDVGAAPSPELNGGAAGDVPVGDGGDHAAIQSFADDVPQRDSHDVADLVEYVASWISGEYSREEAATYLTEGSGKWTHRVMDRSTLTTDEILDRAEELNDERQQASVEDVESGPRAVADANGGVRIE